MITKGLFVKLKIRYHDADQNTQSINIALSQLIHWSFVEQQIFSVSTIYSGIARILVRGTTQI